MLVAVYIGLASAKITPDYSGVNAVYSRVGLGLAGVMSVGLAVTAGFGICTVFGLRLSSGSLTLAPLVSLAICIHNVFTMITTMSVFRQEKAVVYRMKARALRTRTARR